MRPGRTPAPRRYRGAVTAARTPASSAFPALSVLDLVPVSAGRSRADALAEMVELARTADRTGYARYYLAEHHGSTTFLASATTVLMGQVLAATERIGVSSGGVMLPNHAPLVIAEQIGTLATMYPGRVGLGIGRAPGTDPITAAALRRRAADPGRFTEEILEVLAYLGEVSGDAPAVPGSLLPDDDPGVVAPAIPQRVRAVPGEGTSPRVAVLGSSVNGARVAGSLGLPFIVASHFAPAPAEAALVTYRSVFDAQAPTAVDDRLPHASAAVNVMVAETAEEAERLFSTQRAASARTVGGRPAPLDPPSEDVAAWRSLASGKDRVVEASLALSFVGTADDVAARLRELAEGWDLDEVLVLTYAHDAAARRQSYELLAEAW